MGSLKTEIWKILVISIQSPVDVLWLLWFPVPLLTGFGEGMKFIPEAP